MKSLAPYFGNRIATVAAKTKKSARKVKPAVSEMEALESRILLSGIVTDGSKSYKKLTYTDLEGDKVTISISKGTFTITSGVAGDGKELLQLNTLNINSATENSVLKIDVKSVKPGGDGDAFTEIGTITSSADDIKQIRLNGANVSAISLANTNVDAITLSAKAADKLDRQSPGTYKALENVNYGSVTALSLDLLQSATTGAEGGGLDFDGPITVSKGSLSLVGQTSDLNANVNAATISNLNVGSIGKAVITTSGDLTINTATLGATTFNVTGNLHLGITSGGITGASQFNVGGSISGVGASDSDAISIVGESDAGTIVFNAGTSIADINVTGAFDAELTASTTIGNIDASGDLTLEFLGAARTATTGSIGNITSGGVADLTFNKAANRIGSIEATDIDLDAALTLANGNGINITATGAAGTIDQDIEVTNGALGNINLGGTLGKDITVKNGSLGSVTVGIDLDGDISVTNTTTATAATIGAIEVGGNLNGLITSGGAVASLTVDGDVTVTQNAMHSITGNILIGGNLDENIQTVTAGIGGTITVVGDLNASIIAKTGNIGTVSLGTASAGVITATAGNIGNITLTDTTTAVDNSLTLTTVATTGTIGSITANTAYATSQKVTLTVTNAITVGDISITNSTASINNNLVTSGFAAVTTLNDIFVDGDLNLTSTKFAAVTSAGNIQADTIQLPTQLFLASGADIGSITVGQFVAAAGVVIGNNTVDNGNSIGFINVSNASAANTVAFRFDGYTSAAGTVITDPASTTQVGSVIDAGVTAILSPSLMTSGAPQAVGSLTFAIV
jgi:hypothetical protein